jgi:hypothetical protein
VTSALDDLAAQWSGKIVRGPWGQQIVEAMRAGADSLALPAGMEQLFQLDPRLIEVALGTRQVMIRNVLAEGVRWVNEQVASAIITGVSTAELSRTIEGGCAWPTGSAVPAWRADLIARNEPFAAYRETQRAAAEKQGIALYQMRGPVDRRTSVICLAHIGQTKSAEESGEDREALVAVRTARQLSALVRSGLQRGERDRQGIPGSSPRAVKRGGRSAGRRPRVPPRVATAEAERRKQHHEGEAEAAARTPVESGKE